MHNSWKVCNCVISSHTRDHDDAAFTCFNDLINAQRNRICRSLQINIYHPEVEFLLVSLQIDL
jgi:hypothetical protein